MNYKRLKRIAIILSILLFIIVLSIIFIFVKSSNLKVSAYNTNENNQADISNSSNTESAENFGNIEISNELIDLKELAENSKKIPDYDFYFELPINGTTGYASIESNIRESGTTSAEVIKKISPGAAFEILEEKIIGLK